MECPSLQETLSAIYSESDEMMSSGRFEDLDRKIAELNPREMSVDVMLGWLTATLPAKSKLPARSRFLSACLAEIVERGEWESGLLTGL